MTEATASTVYSATPNTRLMDSTSRLPQYWLNRTVEPLWTPKINSWMTNRGTLARVTAAMGTSPSIPTMKVSTRFRLLVIRFCSTIGVARAATSR